jgi:hypothetical protein
MEQNKRSGRDAKRSYWGDHIAGWKQSGLFPSRVLAIGGAGSREAGTTKHAFTR